MNENKRKIIRTLASYYETKESDQNKDIKSYGQKFLLICFSVLLFFLANPNPIIKEGLGFLCFVYYVPVLLLVKKSGIAECALYGFLYGFSSYFLYLNWIKQYGTASLVVLCIFYGFILALVFVLLKSSFYFQRWGHKDGSGFFFEINSWLAEWCILCFYEFLKTKTSLGLNYGVSVYCLWKYLPLIQITKITGPFGLNCFVLLCSSALYSIIDKIYLMNNLEKVFNSSLKDGKIKSHVKYFHFKQILSMTYSLHAEVIAVFLIISFFAYSVFLYHRSENESPDYIKVAAIQNNDDPWDSDVGGYAMQIQKMISITKEVLELNPDIKIVVWPETAVVPAVVYNYTNKREERRYKMIERLLQFINQTDLTFVIGNGHYGEFEGKQYKRYNSSIVFTGKNDVIPPYPEIYSKNHLVPFSEYFPWKKQMPFIYKKYFKDKKIIWEPGTEITVFEREGVRFSTPICFEDTFPEISRSMVLKGAEILINLSNDSWAASSNCQLQHLAMAVFRSIENSVYSVRSTASGETCVISDKGKIISRCKPFSEGFAVGKIPLNHQTKTFYTLHGDFMMIFPLIFFCSLLLIKIFTVIIDTINLRKKYG